MKKTLLYCICFVVIICNFFSLNSFATIEEENNTDFEQNQVIEESQQVQNIEEQCQAEVKNAGQVKDSEENPNIKVQDVTLEILNGAYKGKEVTADYVITEKENAEKIQLQVGDEVNVVMYGDLQGNLFVKIQSLNRNTYVIIMFLIILISLLLLYEKHAIKPALSCLITVLLLYFLLFKQLINGQNIILISLLFGVLLLIIETIINTGLNKKIWISLAGTITGVLGSIIVEAIFIILTRINIDLQSISGISNSTLVIAGCIVTTFGCCINIAIHIIQNLDKKKIETKDFFRKDLFKLGIIYGSQQAIKYINLAIMLFAGLYLETIVVNSENYNNLLSSLNQDSIFAGMISITSTCCGIIISVVITSIFYALINSKKTIYKTMSDNKIEGKRSLKI